MNIDELKLIGWTKWEGGACPVPDGWLTEVMYDTGLVCITNSPECLGGWERGGGGIIGTSIRAYKQIQVGVCQNGDPIIIGGVYEVDGGKKVIMAYYHKHNEEDCYPFYVISDDSSSDTLPEMDFNCFYKPESTTKNNHHLLMRYGDA